MPMATRRIPPLQVLVGLLWSTSFLCSSWSVESLSTNPGAASSSSSSSSSSSPWSPSTWSFTFDFGLEDNNGGADPSDSPDLETARTQSRIFPDLQSSESRLILKDLEIRIDSAAMSKKDEFLGSPAAFEWYPVGTTSYINRQGEQTVQFAVDNSGWSLEFPKGMSSNAVAGHASLLRGVLKLETALDRNGIQLPAGECLYLQALAWREDDWEIGRRRIQPLYEDYLQKQETLNQVLSHQTGDRRLDGTNLVDTLQAYGDVTQLVLAKEAALQAYRSGREVFPPPKKERQEDCPEGPWPGNDAWLTLSRNNPIWVARSPARPSILGGVPEYFQVGKWNAQPILQEGDYEWVDQD